MNEKERRKRISEGQTAIFAYPSAFSAAKVRLTYWYSKELLKKGLLSAFLNSWHPHPAPHRVTSADRRKTRVQPRS